MGVWQPESWDVGRQRSGMCCNGGEGDVGNSAADYSGVADLSPQTVALPLIRYSPLPGCQVMPLKYGCATKKARTWVQPRCGLFCIFVYPVYLLPLLLKFNLILFSLPLPAQAPEEQRAPGTEQESPRASGGSKA